MTNNNNPNPPLKKRTINRLSHEKKKQAKGQKVNQWLHIIKDYGIGTTLTRLKTISY